ncbi:MAG TPA: SDR family NAD(P)-dependent oxidoreductase [Kiritimatiellia bacterium]|nr:SDR family NAD(P)-dependent oxidoreductase [Kiritimatiellia bacterium]
MRIPPPDSRTVLVTGCSSGIGAATARLLRDAGWIVYPAARKPEDLETLRADGFDPVALDLADPDSVAQAADAVLARTGGRLGALVNNAGYCQAGAMEDISRAALRAQFETNVFGLHDLTRALLPAFRRQHGGRIVNVSSVFGRLAAPMVGSYCASKFALEALSDALRIELRGTGIWVALIEPGAILSRFRKNAAETLARSVDREQSAYGSVYAQEIERRRRQVKKADFFTRPPEDVARRIRHALESPRPRRRYRVTPAAALAELAVRWIPAALTDRLLARRVPPRTPDPSGGGR